MALKITLKPHERLIIGGAVIANGGAKSDYIVENTVPVLREKDILSLKGADTVCRRIYFSIQLMYVDEKNLTEHHKTYWELVKDVIKAAPSARGLIQEISELILQKKYYQALKAARKLMEFEQEVMSNVRKSTANL